MKANESKLQDILKQRGIAMGKVEMLAESDIPAAKEARSG